MNTSSSAQRKRSPQKTFRRKNTGRSITRDLHGNPREAGLVVGVDIGGSNLRVALAEMHGTVLGKWRASTKVTSSPEMVVAQIEQGVGCLLKQCGASRSSLMSVAAGAPGVTNADTGMVIATSFLRGWSNVPFQKMLESSLHVPAAVENDVRMAAIGEHWIGVARGVDDFVFLALGTGIAAGIFANGRLLRGTRCSAGEVGYMYVPGASPEAVKPGAPGSLESSLGGTGIRQEWLKADGIDAKLRDLTATEIFDLAAQGDPGAERILDRSANLLAYAAYNISLVLDSSLFVLGGGVGMSSVLRDATQRILGRYNEPVLPRLVTSTLGEDAQLMGTIQLAMTVAASKRKL